MNCKLMVKLIKSKSLSTLIYKIMHDFSSFKGRKIARVFNLEFSFLGTDALNIAGDDEGEKGRLALIAFCLR